MPPRASGRALTLNRLAILVTALGWLAYLVTTVVRQFVSDGLQSMRFASEAISYAVIVTALAYSATAYLVARQGFLYRTRTHRRTPKAEIDTFFGESMPTLTVLVPSFREDAHVVRQTLLSAALQEYPYMRVVLLIDDPPAPTDPAHVQMLEEARALPAEIAKLLALPRARFEAMLEAFQMRIGGREVIGEAELRDLAALYEEAARRLEDLSGRIGALDHVDSFFANHVVGRLSGDLAQSARALRAAADEGAEIPVERAIQLYRRLAWIFRAELTSFERKRYASLPQDPNKAMNLNSYLALMGRSFREIPGSDGIILTSAPAGASQLDVPDADYVLTLDADSVLLPGYCLRLVHLLEQPENSRVAVAQTPYSSFPGAPTRLERMAGATTDLQHIVHQGMTHYDATFWVGANAVLRKVALDDIGEMDSEPGSFVRRYIQDRTVIEDTESSVDLGLRGWTLVNYGERLSYSATPPDFGSLCIQRQRWSNGGLLIVPKLWRHMRDRRRRGEGSRLGERFLRFNYLASTAWSSLGLLVLLAYPFYATLLSPLVVLSAAPYFMAMAADLRRCGYKRVDAIRIYGFNLILLPVTLSGMLLSLWQGITGRRLAFKRTPKVRNRTMTPASFALLPYVMVAFSIYTLVRDLQAGHWAHAAFAGINAVMAFYAIVAFIGLRDSVVDGAVGLARRLYRPTKAQAATSLDDAVPANLDWAAVLECEPVRRGNPNRGLAGAEC